MPFQEAPETVVSPQLAQACKLAVHVVTREGQVLRAGGAVLFVLGQIGYRRQAKLLAAAPWVWFVEPLYKLVADHRAFFSRFLFRD